MYYFCPGIFMSFKVVLLKEPTLQFFSLHKLKFVIYIKIKTKISKKYA